MPKKLTVIELQMKVAALEETISRVDKYSATAAECKKVIRTLKARIARAESKELKLDD